MAVEIQPPTVFGLSAVARAAGVAEQTVRNLAKTGVIKCTRDSANRRVFDQRAIDTLRRRARNSTHRRP